MTQIQLFNFRGEALEVVKEGADLFISVRRVCEALGIDPKSQGRKLAECEWAVEVTMTSTGPDGKQYLMTMLHVDSLPLWLATIKPGRVAEAARPTLLAFQKEAARVLADHFLGKRGEPRELTVHEREAVRRQARQDAYHSLAVERVFTHPHSTKSKKAEVYAIQYKGSPNTVEIWIDLDCDTILDEPLSKWCKASAAYEHYCSWCVDNDHTPVTNKFFGEYMGGSGLSHHGRRGSTRYAIAIVPPSDGYFEEGDQ